ncbi:MAG: fumarate hydratase [Clostridia bacterium]|nr:fumarate hydratase [Clostridia bacterium]MDE7328434.1 fumarate hydratase [Clostridia bacterium]
MIKISTRYVADKIKEAIDKISCEVEPSCREALAKAYEKEDGKSAKFALEVMLENIDIAKTERRPVCQDTGMVVVFLEIGKEVFLTGKLLQDEIDRAVEEAYATLRKSVLDPVTRINTKTNTPAVVHTSIVEGEDVKVQVMLKGFGSENMSKVYLLNPAQGLEEAKRLIVNTVATAASNPCPPVIIGVGLGGTLEKAALMSKRALFRKIGSENPIPHLNELEKSLLDEINSLGVGAQGFGGKTTALGVFIESYPTHISSLPVSVNVLCHCSRAAEFVIQGRKEGEVCQA